MSAVSPSCSHENENLHCDAPSWRVRCEQGMVLLQTAHQKEQGLQASESLTALHVFERKIKMNDVIVITMTMMDDVIMISMAIVNDISMITIL